MAELRNIQCPYCFKIFGHDQVHFRAERMVTGDCPSIPDRYDDFDDFRVRANLDSAENRAILQQCSTWEFFRERDPRDDEEYRKFWTIDGEFHTTERESRNKASNRSRVINPADVSHQNYLKQQEDGGWLRYDADGYAVSVELKDLGFRADTGIQHDGTICTQRVCPYCHNPLPNQYGKNEVRFIAVIGTTGSGKTVYLSQLMYGFEDYVAKVGLTAMPTFDSALRFRQENPVNVKTELPGSTPPKQFLQPLFYDLAKKENGHRKVYTLVLYDVAGENCTFGKGETWFRSRFIQYMHGIFLLIDPGQFKVIQGLGLDDREMVRPTDALNSIHDCLCVSVESQCDIPLAICISKSDMDALRDVLSEELTDKLDEEVQEALGSSGESLAVFNAQDYNTIAVELHDFIHTNEKPLEQNVTTNYSCYNYFAFSSLGCDVDESGIPVGPIIPKRIEEPLLWLFNKFGFIAANEDHVIEFGHPCPKCHSSLYRRKLGAEERVVVLKRTLFGKVKDFEEYNYKCDRCKYYYN